MYQEKIILLTFDVEEFDLPREFDGIISDEKIMQVGKAGTDRMQQLLEEQQVTSTLFTTANFAVHFPDAIQSLSANHEIASHTYFHSNFTEAHLLESRVKLEEITGKKITGLRMPRFKKIDIHTIKEAGYLYDSSINPFWLPGRYNNLHLPQTFFYDADLLRIPVSVSTGLRIPLFWLSFKHLPYPIYKKLALYALNKYGYLNLYFHPWEFTPLQEYGIPGYLKKNSGDNFAKNLSRLIKDLKEHATFMQMGDFAQKILQKK